MVAGRLGLRRSNCGIIPDSGTTMITGPTAGIKKLQEKLCEEWPRPFREVSRVTGPWKRGRNVSNSLNFDGFWPETANLWPCLSDCGGSEADSSRCRALGKPSVLNFQTLLVDCASWLTDEGLKAAWRAGTKHFLHRKLSKKIQNASKKGAHRPKSNGNR